MKAINIKQLLRHRLFRGVLACLLLLGTIVVLYFITMSFQARKQTSQSPVQLAEPRSGLIVERDNYELTVEIGGVQSVIRFSEATMVRELGASGLFVESNLDALQPGKIIVVTIDAQSQNEPVWSIDVIGVAE